MLVGLAPVAKKALDAATGPERFENPENLGGTTTGDFMAKICQCLTDFHVGQYPTNTPDLLHTHSTLCLQHQEFPTTPRGRWDFTCMGSGCLRDDSNDYRALAESLDKYGYSHWKHADRIWRLLTAVDLPMEPMASHFFDERFPDRCGVMLLADIDSLFTWETPKGTLLQTPSFRLYSCVTASRCIRTYHVAEYTF